MMNGDLLGQEIMAAIDAVPDKTDRESLMKAIGGAIVNHIVINAIVTVTSVSAVTPGAGVSGPGTGAVS